ncbi:MAG: acetamidase/formamidase family protein [Caulobacteraceae bacterium]|nr:acetamidase/formamidase family protein [Caulobacteraceae bacterium]
MMNSSHFTTEAYPGQPRLAAWRETLSQFQLSVKDNGAGADLYGTMSCATSRQGFLFGRVASGSQSWSLKGGKPGGMVVVLHMEGAATLTNDAGSTRILPGDVIYAPNGAVAEIAMAGAFRQLLVRVPREPLQTRLATPLLPRAGRLSGRTGMGHVLSGLLGSVADAIDDLTADQLQSIDIALPEFLAASLAGERDNTPALAATSGQTATLYRVSQLIEARLNDPELNLAQIADLAGVSVRYLQKLFEGVNDSFGRYLKQRRLERCRSDLANPLYMHLSITDICFRWGFSEAAHFSRVFREQYGMSPRSYRAEVGGRASQDLLDTMSRGWPDITHDTYKKLTRNESGPAQSFQVRAIGDDGPYPIERAMAHPRTVNGFRHHHLPASEKTVHWGYFSHALQPTLEVESGDYVTMETLSHHCGDDYERMIKGDSGAESVYHWTTESKNVARRGAGPMGANIYGRGQGEGFGVHICTGPVAVKGAEPGDVIELRILDVRARPSANALYADRAFGVNTASWWGFHNKDMMTEPRPREVVTVYEIDCSAEMDYATAIYSYRWTPQTDPDGVVHSTIDYPGVVVDHSKITKTHEVLKGVRAPVRPHFGIVALAPREADLVDSTPPSYFGGNIDNRRMGKGSTVYLPVSVPGGLLSVGDPHAAQGDGEVSGTAIDCSMTGVFQIILHKKADHAGKPFADLNYPLLETPDEWVVHGFSCSNYLAELGQTAQSEIYKKSSLDTAMRDAVRKMRRFLMTAKGLSEDEAVSLMSVAVDFSITQVVDGNWGVHGVLKKALFAA